MSITITQIGVYVLALFILFLTPGPVWLAVIARALSGGFRAAWPLALGVALGDVLWPLVAIFGISAILALYADFLIMLRYAAALILIIMGLGVIRYADKLLTANTALTKSGIWAGFLAGLLAVTANPKASLFYMGLLPGFFDMAQLTAMDVMLICLISFTVPLMGNLMLIVFMNRVRRFLASSVAVKRTNIAAGAALIVVGLGIALT